MSERVLRVGALYNPKIRRWPEGAQYNYRGGEHELLLLFPNPSRSEVNAVAGGEAELALYVEQPAVVLLYRFGREGAGIPWSDAPFAWHRVPEHERALPTEAEANAVLRVVLVDAVDGVVRALRLTMLPEGFTRALHDAIRAQASAPWDERAFDQRVQALYQRFPDCGQMVRAAGHITKLSAKTGQKRDA